MEIPKDQRLALMSPEHWGLNAEQTAAFLDDSPTVTIACPGSGKTRLSIARAVKYVLRHGPTSVLMVTFSRQAADEIRKRLAAAIGAAPASKVKIGTYHGLAHELLRAHYKSKRKVYRVVREGQARAIILRARDRIASNLSNDDVLAGVARIKATYVTDDEIRGKTDPLSLVFLAYQDVLRDLRGKDFADLIRETTALFNIGELRPFPVKYVIPDEFQDSDRMQYLWLLAHHRAGAVLHAVGDDDQSIYGFRNAMGHIALRGLGDDIGANVHFLTTNYRCGRDIVGVADHVISENVGRIAKKFQVGSKLPGQVVISAYRDAVSEAEAVIQQFQDLVDGRGIEPISNEYAVMHRTNFGLDYLEMAAVGCKYRVVREGGASFVDRPHVSQALAILRLGLENDQRLSWHEAVPLAGLTPDGTLQFESYIRKLPEKTSMVDAIYAKEWLDQIGKQDKTLFNAFRSVVVEWIDAVAEILEAGGPHEQWDKAITRACGRISSLTSDRNHRKDIDFLGRVLASKLSGPLASRLARVAQKREPPEEESANTPILKIMTLHGSKGLEFDAVWLIGLNEGCLPSANSDTEEERRLFYVGITRAMAKLHISYLKSPETVPSKFLDRLLKAAAA